MVQDNGIDLIVNCAAYTDVNRAESDSETADLMNHVAVGGMAAVMKERGGTLVHISTDYVFDGNACVPYRETDPTCPVSVYGETKLKGERAIIDSECNYLIFRTSWLYSEWGRTSLRLCWGCSPPRIMSMLFSTRWARRLTLATLLRPWHTLSRADRQERAESTTTAMRSLFLV